jgi:protein-disulfide isomerase
MEVKVAADDPGKGPATAPVQIVEFSDFQCPFCSRVVDTVKKIEDVYGDKVRVVFKQFPLPMHNQAAKAAEAAECAREQGKFWEMHDKLFANQRALAPENLKQYAADLTLDKDKFAACLDQSKMKDGIAKDMAAGSAAGVTGTPAFFVNGRFVSGAVPFENFKQLIDEELGFKNIPVPAPKG